MAIVTEVFDQLPFDEVERLAKRSEPLIFEKYTGPTYGVFKLDRKPLPIHTIPTVHAPVAFSPPQGLFESASLRLEWQMGNLRQPLIHRNADCEEIGFQVCGRRILMTEVGTVEFQPGQFARIPVGVAHDNLSVEDVHLIFYFPGPVQTCVAPTVLGQLKIPPFTGWQNKTNVEITTAGLAAPNTDLSYRMVDEELMFRGDGQSDERLSLIEPSPAPGETQWIYKAPKVWIGSTHLERSATRCYRCHLSADEIQYQVSGTRTLLTQSGTATLSPGDLVQIPQGCSFTSFTEAESRHLSILTTDRALPIRQPTRHASMDVTALLK